MGKLAARKNRVKQMVSLGAVNPAAEELLADLDARVEAIQLLIPLGLQAVAEELGPSGRRIGWSAVSTQGFRAAAPPLGLATWVSVSGRPETTGDRATKCATWKTARKSPWMPTRLCRRLGEWTKVCCCEC